jgi:hypothetical protein
VATLRQENQTLSHNVTQGFIHTQKTFSAKSPYLIDIPTVVESAVLQHPRISHTDINSEAC